MLLFLIDLIGNFLLDVCEVETDFLLWVQFRLWRLLLNLFGLNSKASWFSELWHYFYLFIRWSKIYLKGKMSLKSIIKKVGIINKAYSLCMFNIRFYFTWVSDIQRIINFSLYIFNLQFIFAYLHTYFPLMEN